MSAKFAFLFLLLSNQKFGFRHASKICFSVFVALKSKIALQQSALNALMYIHQSIWPMSKAAKRGGIKVAILFLLHWYTSIIVILLSKYYLHFYFELLET